MDLTYLLSTHFAFVDPEIELIETGEENQNFKVSLPQSQYLLRVYSKHHSTTGRRSRKQIEQEHRFLKHLVDQGIHTPLPLKNQHGELLFETDEERFAALFQFFSGGHPAEYTDQVARNIGSLTRRIRLASSSFREEPVRQWKDDDIGSYLEVFHAVKEQFEPAQLIILDQISSSVESSLNQMYSLEKGYIHGDVKLENVLISSDKQVFIVIDFDDFRVGYFLEELARTILHDLHDPRRNVIRSGHAMEVIDGYQPSNQELILLKPFLQARFLYDLGSYIRNDLGKLVDELVADQHIQRLLLPQQNL